MVVRPTRSSPSRSEWPWQRSHGSNWGAAGSGSAETSTPLPPQFGHGSPRNSNIRQCNVSGKPRRTTTVGGNLAAWLSVVHTWRLSGSLHQSRHQTSPRSATVIIAATRSGLGTFNNTAGSSMSGPESADRIVVISLPKAGVVGRARSRAISSWRRMNSAFSCWPSSSSRSAYTPRTKLSSGLARMFLYSPDRASSCSVTSAPSAGV